MGEQRTTRADKNTSDRYKAPGTRLDASATAPNPSANSLHSISGSSEGRLNITFCLDFPYVALPDLGADDNVLPRSLFRSLESKGFFVPLRSLERPLEVSVAVQTPGFNIQVTQQAPFTVKVQLPAGLLSLRNVHWLVAELAMDEVLLGRPLLKELGIDAPAHLAAVRDEFHNMDCSHVSTTTSGGKLSRLLVKHDTSLTIPELYPITSMPLLLSPPALEEAPNTHVAREPATAANSVMSGTNVQQPLPEVISAQSQKSLLQCQSRFQPRVARIVTLSW
jgi:hypothetical protein